MFEFGQEEMVLRIELAVEKYPLSVLNLRPGTIVCAVLPLLVVMLLPKWSPTQAKQEDTVCMGVLTHATSNLVYFANSGSFHFRS